MVHASIIALAAALFGSTVVSAVGPWGQCGGQGWTGGTTCDAGWVCTFSNPYYSQCLQGTGPVTTASTSTTTSKGVTTTSKAPSGPSTTTKPISTTSTTTSPSGPGSTTSSSPPPASSDNPFIGVTPFLSPFYNAEIDAAVANITAKGNTALAARAAKVKAVPNFTWIDVAAKVPTIGTYLASALALQQSSGVKQVVQIVIYDLPDRDCAALASNGEYSIANGGAAHYQAYIDGIAAQISAYPDVRVIAVYEPDSLANLVTNLNVAKCSGAQSTYLALAKYAINKLTQPNLSLYLDAGHAGWLGWPANIGPAAQLFGQLLAGTNKPNRVRGLATNVANYNAYQAASPDPITQGNSNYDEIHFINALAPLLTSNGFPAHFIVDTSRSGVQNIRSQWGDWCNVLGAGFGLRPTTNTGSAYVDALTWVKPGGECDGTSDQTSVRYDAHCGQADATKPAPEAGTWFELQFETLLTAANPAF